MIWLLNHLVTSLFIIQDHFLFIYSKSSMVLIYAHPLLTSLQFHHVNKFYIFPLYYSERDLHLIQLHIYLHRFIDKGLSGNFLNLKWKAFSLWLIINGLLNHCILNLCCLFLNSFLLLKLNLSKIFQLAFHDWVR